jgi:hypothetical protein
MKTNCVLEPTSSTRITELRDLLGYDVLLLRWPLGSKGTKRKWGHLTIDAMSDPDYLAKLDSGNIGIALGEKSGHLCALDIDADKLVEPFIAANPVLKDTLQTHGARGRVFWLRMTGDYPAAKVQLKTGAGDDCGEFRTNGCQSIIHGQHPDGQPYQFVRKQPPISISYSEIDFGCLEDWLEKMVKTKTAAICKIARPLSVDIGSLQTPSVHISPLKSPSVTPREVEQWIQETKPTGERQNHHKLFELARRVKGWEQKMGIAMPPEQIKSVFNGWHARAIKFLSHSKTEYWFEFEDALEDVRYPHGAAVLTAAWERAQKSEPPPEAMQIEDPKIRLLVSLCRELQQCAGDKPFILPARVVQRLFHHDQPMRGWRWLNGLCRMKILEKVRAGNAAIRETNLYRYHAEQGTTAKEL